MKPLLSNKNEEKEKIVVVENDDIISEDKNMAEKFGNYFKSSGESLLFPDDDWVLTETGNIADPVQIAVNKFEHHPSINEIKRNVNSKPQFSFKKANLTEIETLIKSLDEKKSFPDGGIPIKWLKECSTIVAPILLDIWNNQILTQCKFPNKLKEADISPLHKSLDKISLKNYRPVSILHVVSKIFEKIMQNQMNDYVESMLSPFLCGFRKGYSTQYALVYLIEKWKETLDKGGFACALLMDLSKAFDMVNHELLIAKLAAYGFSQSALKLLFDYLLNRCQRVKINLSHSSWFDILLGVPQGSILGPLLFNLFINDLLYFIRDVCNFADDTTPFSFGYDLNIVLKELEEDSYMAIFWFEINFFKLNMGKCKFLLGGKRDNEYILEVGSRDFEESQVEKLLGLDLDNKLKFDTHIKKLCKKAGNKVTILAKGAKFMTEKKRVLLMKTFFDTQFSYCQLCWMFCGRVLNNRINHIHERVLRITYNYYISNFSELISKNGCLTIHHRNIHRVAIEMYKVKNGLAPEFIKSLFTSSSGLQTRSGRSFQRPNNNSVWKGDLSFKSFGPIVWDQMLPCHLKSEKNLNSFKAKLKKWVPDNCHCRICREYVHGVGFIE